MSFTPTVAPVIARMQAILAGLARADGVACFTRLYREVTEGVQARLGGAAFADPEFLAALDVALRRTLLRRGRRGRARRRCRARGRRSSTARSAERDRAAPVRARRHERAHQPRPPGRARRDLPRRGIELERGSPQHADFLRVNGLLARSRRGQGVVHDRLARAGRPRSSTASTGIDDVVAMWNVEKARDAAWANGEALWALRDDAGSRPSTSPRSTDGRLRRPRAARAGRHVPGAARPGASLTWNHVPRWARTGNRGRAASGAPEAWSPSERCSRRSRSRSRTRRSSCSRCPTSSASFDVSIAAVSWVVTSYNLALAIAALALVRGGTRRDPRRLALAGGSIFLAASLACAAAPEIWSLVASRTVQGIGAALLLVGALPLARRLAPTPSRGTALWTGASVFGAALGPALGGVLTEAFGWRAIFVAQAPVAALAVVAVVAVALVPSPPVRGDPIAGAPEPRPAGRGPLARARLGGPRRAALPRRDRARRRVAPHAAAGRPRRQRDPARHARRDAALATARRRLGRRRLGPPRRRAPRDGAAAGARPGVGRSGARGRGLGYGLLVPRSRAPRCPARATSERGAARSGCDTRGSSPGLLVLTPVLTGTSRPRATRRSCAESRPCSTHRSGGTKLDVAIRLAPVLSRPARKGLPDFASALRSDPAPAARGLGPRLDAVVRASVALGFRRSFALAALFALLAAVPVAVVAGARAGPRPALAAAVVVAVALVGAELASGALAFGTRPRLLPACAERSPPPQGAGLRGLDAVACGVGTSREELVAGAARNGLARPSWPCGSSARPAASRASSTGSGTRSGAADVRAPDPRRRPRRAPRDRAAPRSDATARATRCSTSSRRGGVLKHENHQPTGAFKVRGGINLVSRLETDGARRGV